MNRYEKWSHLLKAFKTTAVIRRNITKEAMASETAVDYCAKIVKQHDYENFLATLLMTKTLRSPTLILRAFNVEIARIQDQTLNPQTAEMRLQFWRDTLQDIYKKGQSIKHIPANPVAKELFKVCSCYSLQRRYLEKLVTSRTSILKSKYFKSLEDIEKYADDSVSSMYYLILGIAGVKDVHADHAASHLGKAQGLSNILRSVPVSSYHKVVSLPMDLLSAHNVSQEDVLRCADSTDMRNVVFEVATRAHNHLLKARSIVVPKTAHQIFLPAISVDNYLKRLQHRNFNIFDKSLQLGSPTLPFSLYFNRVLNRF